MTGVQSVSPSARVSVPGLAMAALLAFANPVEASHGRYLTVCSNLGVYYKVSSKSRVANAANLEGGRACIDVQWAAKPSKEGTYYGKVSWTNDSNDYARYPIEIDETLKISSSGRCSASYQVTYNGPEGYNAYFDSRGCQFEEASQVTIGKNH